MSPARRLGYQIPLLLAPSVRTMLRAMLRSGEPTLFDARYLPRALFALGSGLITAPLRAFERARYHGAIRASRWRDDPVFVIGHWRSGTTHMHNLLCQDARFGYVVMLQTILPDLCILGRRTLAPLLDRLLPSKRPGDNMVWSPDLPQEEEHALAKVFPYAFYAQLLLPHRLLEVLPQVLLEDAPTALVEEWQRKYDYILRKAAFQARGRQLVTKNPINTGRVSRLVELYPNARFVFMVRDPYAVFLSIRNFYEELMPMVQFERTSRAEIQALILAIYNRVHERYLRDRKLVSKTHLVEVRYEDLETDPLAEVERVYETLELPDLDAALPALRTYVEGQASYQKNRFDLDPADVEQVNAHWNFAFDEWGYPRR